MMSAAALTPRVRILAVCDEAIPSEIEEGVFTLEGVRQYAVASAFPYRHSLSIYLLLSSARKGTYSGKIRIVDIGDTRTVRYQKIQATFDQENEMISLVVDLGECEFPEPGQYLVQVFLATQTGTEAQKGELGFRVLEQPE
jgi:hypothetical protein